MTRTLPAISVIVPALDEETSLPAAIRSARAAGADEVIVVDGGSEDGTMAIARGLADAAVAAPRGRALQMNAGARVSSGEILLFLHADTCLPAGSIQAVRAAVGHEGVPGGAFSVRLSVSPAASTYTRVMLRLTGSMINLRSRLFRSFTGDQGIFVRRNVFESIGGFPSVPLMEDVLFSRSLHRFGRPLLLPVRIATSGRRWESLGPLRTIFLMWGLRLGHRLGISPDRCSAIYSRGRSRNS